MTDNQESQDNQSFINQAQYQQIKKKITLTNQQLLALTYHQDNFNHRLAEFNTLASKYIQEDKYPQASAYLDQAQKILEYAAGCGKTIERCLINTILNNQACLLQRMSDFQQSANYLQAIIFNIIDFLENFHNPFSINSNLMNCQSQQFIELSIYFERKLSLALYHLRFCALSSHCKKNDTALSSAKKALVMLKKLCEQQALYEDFLTKNKSKCTIDSILCRSSKQQSKNLLKQCSKIKEINDLVTEQQFQKYLFNAVQSLKGYYQRLKDNLKDNHNQEVENVFAQYSIGNLMQASVQDIILKPNHQNFIQIQFSLLGKVYKITHISMAYFTIATQLRLIASSKYSLDEQQKKNSQQFNLSKIYHLVSIIILSKFMPSKSVFFDHALSSFKNHYNLNLIELSEGNQYNYKFKSINHNKSFEIFDETKYLQSQNNNSSDKNNDDEQNNTVQIHSSKQLQKLAIERVVTLCQGKQKSPFKIRHIDNKFFQNKKNKHNKEHDKYLKLNTQYSKLQTKALLNSCHSKNKENKSRNKLLSKSKDMMKSSKKMLKTTRGEQQNRRNIYYGYNNSKSKSKSKRHDILEKRSTNKVSSQMIKTIQIKKMKNDSKIDEEYGVAIMKSPKENNKHKKNSKLLKTSYGNGQQQNIYNMKNSKMAKEQSNLKKLKSPRNLKQEGLNKRQSVSKDKLHL